MKILIATKNDNKVKEIKQIFNNSKIELISLKELNDYVEIEETGNTFKENAIIKAKYIANKYNLPTISDDSGLEVFSLNNEPGIYSARYSSLHATDEENNMKLIENLKNIADRKCRYVCAICLYFPTNDYVITEDYCYGEIIDTPIGENGFGYDRYFYLKDLNKTMAQLTSTEKNLISHRAKAIYKLYDNIKNMI
ncbi:MAG: XTP/dITP diphosphatase [Anaeroplasmataceae bacterium]